MPATPPPRPASECGSTGGQRQQHEHHRDREHAEQVRVVLLAAAAREHVADGPGGEQRQRTRVGAPGDAALVDGHHERRARRAADEEHEQRRPRAVAALEQPAEQEDGAQRGDLVAGRDDVEEELRDERPVLPVERAQRHEVGEMARRRAPSGTPARRAPRRGRARSSRRAGGRRGRRGSRPASGG